MKTLLKNGTLVTASDTVQADILIDGEMIALIGQNLPGDADIAIWDPALKKTMGVAASHQRTDYDLYEGMEVTGWPVKVYSRGCLLVDDDLWHGKPGTGQYIHRSAYAPVI